MGLFTKAAAKVQTGGTTKSKKATPWVLPESSPLNESVREVLKLTAQAKTIETAMGVHKNQLKSFGERQYVDDFVARGVSPETPMTIQTKKGESVTFVVQDRSSQYKVKPEQVEALGQLLGEDRAQELVYTETTFGFNRDVLALPGVQVAIEKALEKAVNKMMDEGVLTEETAEALLSVEQKTAFKPGTLERLTQICGQDTVKVSQMLEIMGSSATRYVKA